MLKNSGQTMAVDGREVSTFLLPTVTYQVCQRQTLREIIDADASMHAHQAYTPTCTVYVINNPLGQAHFYLVKMGITGVYEGRLESS